MGDEVKDKPEVGLGINPKHIKKYMEYRSSRPEKWSPGVRVDSEEEYEKFTAQLASELKTNHTLDQLAVIAAQHMMYADELKCVLHERTVRHDLILAETKKLTSDTVLDVSQAVSLVVLKSYRAYEAKKRGDGVKKIKKTPMALAREIAVERWADDHQRAIRTGAMAEIVFELLKNTEHRRLVCSVGAVRRWIQDLAPDYAQKAGPTKRF